MNQLIEADAEFYFMRQTEFKEFIFFQWKMC